MPVANEKSATAGSWRAILKDISDGRAEHSRAALPEVIMNYHIPVSPVFWLTLLLAVLVSFILPPSVQPQGKITEVRDLLKVLSDASNATRNGLRSGKGSGSYRLFVKRGDDKDMKLTIDADVETCFDRDRYRIGLIYRKEPLGLVKRLIISDGALLVSSAFSARIHPLGAKGEVFAARSSPSVAGFRFNVAQLRAMDFDVLLKNIGGRSRISLNQRADGIIEVTYHIKNAKSVLAADPEVGNNIVSFSVYVEGKKAPVQVERTTWKRSNGVWFAESATDYLETSGDAVRHEFRYERFEPNVSVEPELFRLDSLELPLDCRILDQRPNASPRAYSYSPAGGLNDPKEDNLTEQLKRLRPR
jgi:hypothetical protein